jgi:hypothetical protein
MSIHKTASREYPFVLVSEDSLAFRDHPSAVRELKRRWAAQEPADRVGHFVAKVETYVEPDYGVEAKETPVNGDGKDGDGKGKNGDGKGG